MKIEAVSVSVGYGDILAEVAPVNRPLLDRWVVVTTPEDEETQGVCRRHSIECVITRDFDIDPPFAKAHGINRGLQMLRGDGLLLHLDGDIALPFDFRQCVEDAQLRPGTINGCLRLNVVGAEAWDALKEQGLYAREGGWLVEYANRAGRPTVGGLPAGQETSFVPVGYFQLWFGNETLSWKFPRKFYPTCHNSAARTDVQFGCLWDRRDRVLIPELVVFHLESEPARMGANWKGRTTKRFRGEKPVGGGFGAAGPKATGY